MTSGIEAPGVRVEIHTHNSKPRLRFRLGYKTLIKTGLMRGDRVSVRFDGSVAWLKQNPGGRKITYAGDGRSAVVDYVGPEFPPHKQPVTRCGYGTGRGIIKVYLPPEFVQVSSPELAGSCEQIASRKLPASGAV